MSMTGFGSSSVLAGDVAVSVNVRSVNSRYLDLKIKLPREIEFLEDQIRREIQKRCLRGRITLTVEVEQEGARKNGKAMLDRKRFETYALILDMIEQEYNRKIDIEDVIDIKELILEESEGQVDTGKVMKGIEEALDHLLSMRRQEGEAIYGDLTRRIDRLEETLGNIRLIARRSLTELRNAYESRLRAMIGDVGIEDVRIVQEAAILAEKVDVSEECVRCDSHLKQLRNLLESNRPVGKRMNFLLQEIIREINTIGSKTNQLEITNGVIDMKEGAEQIKEQVQNVL